MQKFNRGKVFTSVNSYMTINPYKEGCPTNIQIRDVSTKNIYYYCRKLQINHNETHFGLWDSCIHLSSHKRKTGRQLPAVNKGGTVSLYLISPHPSRGPLCRLVCKLKFGEATIHWPNNQNFNGHQNQQWHKLMTKYSEHWNDPCLPFNVSLCLTELQSLKVLDISQ